MIISASVCTVLICSCGKFGPALASAASSLRCTSTVLAPDCLRTENDTASSPFSRVVDVRSWNPSTTSPTSLTRTVEPPLERRITSSISAAVLYWPCVRSDTALPSRRTWPPGTSRLSAASRADTSVSGRFSASRRRGSRLTCSSRTWPPFTSTAATPSIWPSSGLMSSSTIRRTTSEGSVADPTAYDEIGSAETSNRLMIGSLICSGSRARIAATFSRTSAVAACGSISSRSSMPTMDSPSAEVEITRLTPLMPATASSIGRVTSVSTSSGPAPGYGTSTLTKGKLTSGKRSMPSRPRETAPSTMKLTMTIVAKTGRLIDVSEIHMT